jgi:protein-S-isoprenylcysteine O-methyltransferase Ste14
MATLHAPRTPDWLGGLAAFVRQAFWVIALGLVLVYAFFLLLGAVKPGDVAAISIGVGILIALWLVRSWAWRRRHADERDPRLIQARERRGF